MLIKFLRHSFPPNWPSVLFWYFWGRACFHAVEAWHITESMSTFVIQKLKQDFFLSFLSWKTDLKGLVDLVAIVTQLSQEGTLKTGLHLKILIMQTEHAWFKFRCCINVFRDIWKALCNLAVLPGLPLLVQKGSGFPQVSSQICQWHPGVSDVLHHLK